ncbi:hypothetical protein Tco_1229768 [Tanacetum coccineum]
MSQENYVEGCSMQRPLFLEADGFCFWKTRFETYIKSKDIDLWHVIQDGDFVFKIEGLETKMMKDIMKKQLGKHNKEEMTDVSLCVVLTKEIRTSFVDPRSPASLTCSLNQWQG